MEKPDPGSHLFIHYVIAVGGDLNTIYNFLQQQIEGCITAIAEEDGNTTMCVACMPDHCHILIDLNFECSIEACIENIKEKSAAWINENLHVPETFTWQEGYAAVSEGLSSAPRLIDHLLNQEEYHLEHSFREEYIALLEENEIDYDEDGLFEFRD